MWLPPSPPARRRRSPDRTSLAVERCAGTALTADAHAALHRNHATLPVGHAVDFDKAIEADANHAIGTAGGAADRRVAAAVEARHQHRGGGRGADRKVYDAAFDLDGNRGRGAVRPQPKHRNALPKMAPSTVRARRPPPSAQTNW